LVYSYCSMLAVKLSPYPGPGKTYRHASSYNRILKLIVRHFAYCKSQCHTSFVCFVAASWVFIDW